MFKNLSAAQGVLHAAAELRGHHDVEPAVGVTAALRAEQTWRPREVPYTVCATLYVRVRPGVPGPVLVRPVAATSRVDGWSGVT